ncbi:hypothetical protein DCAR_0934609 [Daucus carota subsp. sativus]|uniref:ABC transporter domain-containing protein n=1 Tax=Daucus carota subsp. sativus TaxID=79200 RepID=A0AAF0XXY9_DAUCS|nr:PREDICTED: pleiotropic drug resistance protein 1-like [Daucus carota subsp. sativus]WOH15074.1 hypothetical protein DCAR_0934609 [Daucus carota subsp. sativus]
MGEGKIKSPQISSSDFYQSSDGVELTEVDKKVLEKDEMKDLLDRLVMIPEIHNEGFLLKLKQRLDRVGLEVPTIEVRFEHLNVSAEAHVGSRALPSIQNSCANMLEGFLSYLHILPTRKKPLPILQDVSGIIKPGRMVLLLGPPSSGKTTLLLALAGKLGSDLQVSGKVTYNGCELNEFVPQRTSLYISQYDNHMGEMTVRETIDFSARCQGTGSRYDMLVELTRREEDENIKADPDIEKYMKTTSRDGQDVTLLTDYTLKILGLDDCADTIVGNEMIRGISGGEKKRLTAGEMMVGPVRAYFMDAISNGLDSSTSYQIVNSIRQFIHILKGTAVISLLQPAPETYELFDDIILLSDGKIVYQGPCENVLEFFEFMGFKCPERKGVADFLQEVTSRKEQEQYWMNKDKAYSFVSAKEFAEKFQSFHVGVQLSNDLANPYDKAKGHPLALRNNKYGASKKELLKSCVSREYLLMKRNSFIFIFQITQIIFACSVAMTVFLRTEMRKNTEEDGLLYLGALYYTAITLMFNGLAEVAMSTMRLPVFYKQRDLLFFPVWAYSIPTWILKLPVSLWEVLLWVFMTYYAIGYEQDFGRIIKHILVLLCLHQMASALYRCISAIGRSMIIANTLGSCTLLAVLALGGFVLSKDNIHPWWIWGYWISPLMYAQNAIAVNEFLGKSWRHVLPNSTEPLGVTVLKTRGLMPDAYWYWLGIGALVGYMFFFNFLSAAALAYFNPIGRPHAILSEKTFAERSSSEKGNDVGRNITSGAMLTTNGSIDLTSKKNHGMILPFQPLSISFNDIKYAVDVSQELKAQGFVEDRLEILKGVSGAFRPGVLTALMGVSGAGKTTLMDVLAGRKTCGYTEGTIMISGYPKKQETFARIAGYCEQTDIHSPYVTVHESLQYSAWLRLPPEVDNSTKKMFVEEVMELVELTPLKGALVGLPGVDGLSTEQRKRLTIAVELVANPSIIFMDEPTSGLDARAAAIVMRTVRNTVDTGRTVVCTIHQPSIDIFDAFDELILLSSGGEEIYVGPLGHQSSELIEYFEAINGVPKKKDGYNPATWMLDVTSKVQEETLGVKFGEVYKKSELYRRNKESIEAISIPTPDSQDLQFATQYSQSFFTQCIACLWKQHWSYWRNTNYSFVRILFALFTGLLFGTIFWNVGPVRGTKQNLFDSMGSMYAAVTFLGMQSASSVQPVVGVERPVFYRERAAGMYSAIPYAIAQVLIEVVYSFIQTFLYGIIVYAMLGFEWTAVKFLWYIFFIYFTLLYFTFYGMVTVAVTPNPNIAAVFSTFFYGLWNLFSGFIIPVTRIPVWWKWCYYLSPFSWTLYGLLGSQFGDIEEKLENGDTVAQFIKSYFDYDHDFVKYVAVIVFGLAFLFGCIFAVSIKAFNFQKR